MNYRDDFSNKTSFVKSIESLLVDSENGKSLSLPTRLKKLYGREMDMDKSQIHSKMIPDIIKTTALDGITIQKVTRVPTICDIPPIGPKKNYYRSPQTQ